jgi:26S proteasome regulatory subunit N10
MTRNGDYAPTRFQAQADAVNLLAGAKTQHHPENTVGVLTMAGKTPQVCWWEACCSVATH